MNNEINNSKISILFSGGLDSTLLAFIINKLIPLEERYDLHINQF